MQKRRMGKCIRLLLLAASLFGATGCKEESGKDSLPKEPDAAGTISAEYGVTPVLEKKEELPAEKEVTVSYANWTDSAELFLHSLNREKMAISSVQHLPIYKFDTKEELEQFKDAFSEELCFDSGYDEVLSFNDATAGYDDAFFAENTLFLVYVTANSGSLRFAVSDVFCDGEAYCIHVAQTNSPECVTDDMAGWFLTVAEPDSAVERCTQFDADLGNCFSK